MYYEQYSAVDRIAGNELITAFLNANFDDALVENVFVRGLQPALWKEFKPDSKEAQYPENKMQHITDVCKRFGVARRQCILFDDSHRNVHETDGFMGCHVDSAIGFQLTDLWTSMVAL